MSELAVDAVQLLERVYTGNAGQPLHDDGMVVEWIDREIAAFIRQHGPLSAVIAQLKSLSQRDEELRERLEAPIQAVLTLMDEFDFSSTLSRTEWFQQGERFDKARKELAATLSIFEEAD